MPPRKYKPYRRSQSTMPSVYASRTRPKMQARKRSRSKASYASAARRPSKSTSRRVGAKRVYKPRAAISLNSIRQEIRDVALWKAQNTYNSQARYAAAANVQGWIQAVSPASIYELEKAWDLPHTLEENSSLYGAAPSYRQAQIYLYNHRLRMSIGSHTSPAGVRVWVYMLTPRRALSVYEGNLTKTIDGSYDSSGSNAYMFKIDGTLIATRPDQTPYNMGQVTHRYKIKQLWTGILGTGARKDITVNKFMRKGGVLVRQDHYTVPDGSGISLNNMYSLTNIKPYTILVRYQGLVGGDAATNPTTVGITAANISLSTSTSYTFGFGLHTPVLHSTYTTALGLAGYATGQVVSAAGATAFVA